MIRRILMEEWDPIGVADEPFAQDEYDSYIPTIYRLLVEGADEYGIAWCLQQIADKEIGLRPDVDRAFRAAQRLIELTKEK